MHWTRLPTLAMSAAWKAKILRSLDKNRIPNGKYVQLATVKRDGKPSNRTVVFRGFLQDTAKLTFVTDTRSEKVDEIAHFPFGEICWYFPESREQYRVEGKLEVVTADCEDASKLNARQQAWARMSEKGREQFAWPHPGNPRTVGDDLVQGVVPEQNEPALSTFSLVILDPYKVDHLILGKNVRTSYKLQEDGEWDETNVNP